MKPELQDHITNLRAYQAWRTGADTRTLGGAGIIPADVTKALNAVLDFAENHLRDATKMIEPVRVPSDDEVLKIAIDSGLAYRDSTGDVACAWREDADISEYLVENARALLASYGQPAQPCVPNGWPTKEMVTAFADVFSIRDQKGTFAPAFRAALAAAPSLDSPESKENQ